MWTLMTSLLLAFLFCGTWWNLAAWIHENVADYSDPDEFRDAIRRASAKGKL